VSHICCKCIFQMFHLLHSSVSCCTSFTLFGESGGTARAPGNGVRRARGWWMRRAARRCPTDGARLGLAVGARWRQGASAGGANGLEWRRIGRAASARRVLQTRGRCDGAGCSCRAGKIRGRGQVVRVSGRARPSRHLGTNTSVNCWFVACGRVFPWIRL
jgi:hypothetical protein